MVVTITSDGYVSTPRRQYRAQHRGGRGVKARLRGDNVVEHFFVTNAHHLDPVLHHPGRVYRQGLTFVEAGRDAERASAWPTSWRSSRGADSKVMELRSYQDAPYLVLATATAWSRSPASRTTTPTAPA
ncbi:hypothetical protein QJS66_14440 [Kocuria rhizophila]|nr:hypothetical protein QJS66_14440 [Kocuria rhizophila]